MAVLASLPEDIIMDILLMLPVKSISRFRCVCKLWYELLRNPKFIKMHHHHANQNNKFSVLLYDLNNGCNYTIDFDATSSSYHKVVETKLPRYTYVARFLPITTTDGLIGLLYHSSLDKICFWNPLTREHKEIPTTKHGDYRGFGSSISLYGVCYDWKTHDYKLFDIVTKNGDICSEVWVSRLGSYKWKSIGNIPYNIRQTRVSRKPLNGVIHWIGETKVIVSFDIVEERTKEFKIPSCYLDNELYSSYDMEVGVLGDENLYLSVNAEFHKSNLDLWVMKDYGVIDSWTKIFSFSEDKTSFEALWPLHYLSKNGEILLQGVRKEDEGEDALVSYDPTSRRLVSLDIPCMPKHFYALTTFVGGLVSLNEGEFVGSLVSHNSEMATQTPVAVPSAQVVGNAEMATQTPEVVPSAQVVGNAFVEQYYHILHQSPELVFQFYQDFSVLSRPGPDGVMSTVSTIDDINAKILSLNSKEYKSEIKTADAQYSHSHKDGVIDLVTGCLTGKDIVGRKFTQSFFLAPQEKGYFVQNDVFRYVDEGQVE